MNGLLPIIRRQRRPLIIEELKPAVVAAQPVAEKPSDKSPTPPVITIKKADAPGSTQTPAAK
jgi:hypothetical protein